MRSVRGEGTIGITETPPPDTLQARGRRVKRAAPRILSSSRPLVFCFYQATIYPEKCRIGQLNVFWRVLTEPGMNSATSALAPLASTSDRVGK